MSAQAFSDSACIDALLFVVHREFSGAYRRSPLKGMKETVRTSEVVKDGQIVMLVQLLNLRSPKKCRKSESEVEIRVGCTGCSEALTCGPRVTN